MQFCGMISCGVLFTCGVFAAGFLAFCLLVLGAGGLIGTAQWVPRVLGFPRS